MGYYDLPEGKRWMRDYDTPYEIGGWPTDVSNIAHCLLIRIKEAFPDGDVPTEITVRMVLLEDTLDKAERDILEFIDVVSDYVAKKEGVEINEGRRVHDIAAGRSTDEHGPDGVAGRD